MKKANCIAALIGTGMMLIPCTGIAQVAADKPASATTETAGAAATIPVDQQATKEQLAKLFEVMRVREQLQSLMKIMPTMIQEQMKTQSAEMTAKMPGGKTLTPEQQAAMDKLMNNYMEKAFNIYTADEMIADISTIYQRHFSRTDIDAVIAFYGSPAGQHLLDEQPAIMKEYMPLVMSRVQERSKELTGELVSDIAQMSKSVTAPAGKPAAK